MPKFVPASFHPDRALIAWVVKEFKIDKKEVLRQLDLMRDHEFRRSYTCWTRVFRNWMRKADELQQLKRIRKYRQVLELSDEERRNNAEKAVTQMDKYRRV